MLRKKPKEYFEGNGKQEKNFEEVLKGLIEKFEKDVAEHGKRYRFYLIFYFLIYFSVRYFNNEQLLHYEDAIQIDWTGDD